MLAWVRVLFLFVVWACGCLLLAGLGLLSWLCARMVVALVLLCACSWWLVCPGGLLGC